MRIKSEAVSQGRILEFPTFSDERGFLTCVDSLCRSVPFDVKRVFWIYGVAAGVVRGEHAHRTCEEIVIALRGSVDVELTDATGCMTHTLSNPCEGLYIPTMCWCRFSRFSSDCVLLCLASEEYDAAGYINDFDKFLSEIKER